MEQRAFMMTSVFKGEVRYCCAFCHSTKKTETGFFIKVEAPSSAVYLSGEDGGGAKCLECGTHVFFPVVYPSFRAAESAQGALLHNLEKSPCLDWAALVPCYAVLPDHTSLAIPSSEVSMEALAVV